MQAQIVYTDALTKLIAMPWLAWFPCLRKGTKSTWYLLFVHARSSYGNLHTTLLH